MNNLLCFGMGFCAQSLVTRLGSTSWRHLGTARTPQGVETLQAAGFNAIQFGATLPDAAVLEHPLHVLVSAPPTTSGDPVLEAYSEQLSRLSASIRWLGYLSTTGVYGDHRGAWVDEATPPAPRTDRARRRVKAEHAWQAWGEASNVPVSLFRLAGIYGPGRNQLEGLRAGTARRIDKPGQVFSRIHVDDVAMVLEASSSQPGRGELFNVCDDEPCAPEVVVAYAAQLLRVQPPSLEKYDLVKDTLSPMAASFFDESKRVRNARIKEALGVKLQYPTYREGLKALQAKAIG